jgi:hypothetical protein
VKIKKETHRFHHHIENSSIFKEKNVKTLSLYLVEKKAVEEIFNGFSHGVPNGIRTRVAGLKGRRPRPG